jgi:hypothetical protein
MFVCICAMAAGFFFAAIQHFSTMDLGIKNSKLRNQVQDLEAENRRLLLAREISLSPIEITKNARKLGFTSVDEAAPIPAVPIDKSIASTARPEPASTKGAKGPTNREQLTAEMKETPTGKDSKAVKTIASVIPTQSESAVSRPRKVIIVGKKNGELAATAALTKLR